MKRWGITILAIFLAIAAALMIRHWAHGDDNDVSEELEEIGFLMDEPGELSLNVQLIDAVGQGKSSEEIIALIDQGANVNYVSMLYGPPLVEAVNSENFQLIPILLERGANRWIQNNNGYTAYDLARQFYPEEAQLHAQLNPIQPQAIPAVPAA